MQILILNWRDINHPLAGGAEISLFEHAKYWSRRGGKVIWFASSFNRAKTRENIDGITIIRKGSHHTVHLWAFLYFVLHKFGKFDLVIDSFHFIPFFTPLYIRRKKIIALINEPAKNTWFKNISFPFSLIGFIMEPLFFASYKKTQFITGSESISKELQKDYGLLDKNIHVIHHGVTIRKSIGRVKKEKDPTVIYVSMISADKGMEDAIKAIALASRKTRPLHFWIVGKAQDEQYLKRIKKMAQKLGIKKSSTFFGYVSEEKKFDLLSRAWILIHPSIREGWGLNVIEANMYGTPAVGYNVSGLKDSIKHRQTGLLTKQNTPEELAKAITSLIKNKNLLSHLSKNAILWSKKFAWKISGEKSWELIERVSYRYNL